ncbi:hypothetical protein [Nigerium massiliense]|uniref:hypothetical protein n=1 Tax=Nigerium massiliense TaxID=1522317 RepID=UPI000591351A|nr:hypothetical protein [Nigerium massiliense]
MHRPHRSSRRFRMIGAAALAAGSLLLGGCGFSAQTLQSYTPAHGVNLDQGFLKVRNLLIIAKDGGQGVLSGSIVSQREADRLTGITGHAITASDAPGSQLTISQAAVPLPAGQMVVLAGDNGPQIRVSGSDLKPGLTAQLTLTFASGVTEEATVPVMSADDPIYATAVPSGPASSSASPSGSASASPSPTTTP